MASLFCKFNWRIFCKQSKWAKQICLASTDMSIFSPSSYPAHTQKNPIWIGVNSKLSVCHTCYTLISMNFLTVNRDFGFETIEIMTLSQDHAKNWGFRVLRQLRLGLKLLRITRLLDLVLQLSRIFQLLWL